MPYATQNHLVTPPCADQPRLASLASETARLTESQFSSALRLVTASRQDRLGLPVKVGLASPGYERDLLATVRMPRTPR